MARFDFGGTLADFVVTSRRLGGLDTLALSSATLTFWSAQSGGTKYTDLQLNGSSVSSIAVGTDGQVPTFQGPDAITVMWADGGSGRVRIVAQGIPGPAGPGATNTDIAGYVATGATKTALDAAYSSLPKPGKHPLTGWFHADGYGADLTGATSSSAAINAMFAALPSANATVYFPPGTYYLDTPTSGVLASITGKSGITIKGAGQATIIRMNATATDGLRIDGCGSFTMEDLSIWVVGGKITNAIQFTCPINGGAHNGAFKNVYVTNPTQIARTIFDAFSAAGSPVVTSATAAFAAGDVGSPVGLVQPSEVLTTTILSVATRTSTISNGGATMTASTGTLPLSAPLPGVPNSPYTVIVGSEVMLVSGGFQTSTLTVSRAYGQTSIGSTHPDGSTVTTYQATLAANSAANAFVPQAMKVQIPSASVMTNGIAVGSDHASPNLDIPQLKFVGVQVEGAIGCGFRLGGGISGNILNLSHVSCEAVLSTVGVMMNGAVTNWHGPSMGSNGVDFKMLVPSTQPVVIAGVRSELSGMFWDTSGGGTSVGTTVTIRDSTLQSFGNPDGIPVRHQVSIPLGLEYVSFTRPNAGAGITIQANALPGNPLYYQARNVTTNLGNPSPHPPASSGIIRSITSGPRMASDGSGVKADYGNIFDDSVTMKAVIRTRAAQTIAAAGAATIDATAGDPVITLNANVTSSTINTPTAEQILSVTFVQDATGGRTYVWPTNCKFAGGAAPADTTASRRTTVTFRYDSAAASWFELSRAVAVG